MLSDDAKLRERIIDVARNERNGLLIVVMGVFLACSGLIFGVVGGSELAFFGGVFVSALGIFSTLLGFYVVIHYAHQHNVLLNEIQHKV